MKTVLNDFKFTGSPCYEAYKSLSTVEKTQPRLIRGEQILNFKKEKKLELTNLSLIFKINFFSLNFIVLIETNPDK